ncbi:2Fe-2S iron-sulfur cluster binding domain-containing protein [Bradyrhizobium lablabi]|uniref:xanthine dehydrogenase family Fe-S subunit n=1 Tax=Bradyrhizobium lablabi TaxID=722472 RepID=UPI001BA47C47|nr:2Fe-2S iron-sulfur cluster-binding protein [Bradyrhizobium lablabi]MBR1125921.1 2Fe-2S iron-sulfur cluster binding domain-containing protein [Bradyrhizobium lablabi]
MLSVSLTVNGRPVTATVEPRTQLCELLREDLNLTGTHVGCEQGVCGACTVVVDGKPQRSCISYAGDSDGCSVITIEGFDDDALMEQLRDAFSRHHALQCGFCTPGMLVTARDIILRLGETGAARIREELSGNLCRCTGYVGIVEAIEEVSKGKVARAPQTVVAAIEGTVAVRPVDAPMKPAVPPNRPAAPTASAGVGARKGWSSIEQRLAVGFPPEIVWNRLSDIRQVSFCLPGAEITELQDDRVRGRMNVSLGPIKVALNGDGNVLLDAENRIGRLSGRGQDAGSGSSAEGEVEWRVLPGEASGSLILVNLSWRLSGRLAQFNRAGIVQDVIQRLASIFVTNLESSLKGEAIDETSIKPLGIWSLMLGVIRIRVARWRGRNA